MTIQLQRIKSSVAWPRAWVNKPSQILQRFMRWFTLQIVLLVMSLELYLLLSKKKTTRHNEARPSSEDSRHNPLIRGFSTCIKHVNKSTWVTLVNKYINGTTADHLWIYRKKQINLQIWYISLHAIQVRLSEYWYVESWLHEDHLTHEHSLDYGTN